jgi:hypothetical protein
MIWVLLIVGYLIISGKGGALGDVAARFSGILSGTPSPETQPSANTAGSIGIATAGPPLMPYVGMAGAGRAPGASGNLWPPTGQPLGRSLASGANGTPWRGIAPPSSSVLIGWRPGGS